MLRNALDDKVASLVHSRPTIHMPLPRITLVSARVAACRYCPLDPLRHFPSNMDKPRGVHSTHERRVEKKTDTKPSRLQWNSDVFQRMDYQAFKKTVLPLAHFKVYDKDTVVFAPSQVLLLLPRHLRQLLP